VAIGYGKKEAGPRLRTLSRKVIWESPRVFRSWTCDGGCS
jgi:hypothetical protein